MLQRFQHRNLSIFRCISEQLVEVDNMRDAHRIRIRVKNCVNVQMLLGWRKFLDSNVLRKLVSPQRTYPKKTASSELIDDKCKHIEKTIKMAAFVQYEILLGSL